MAIPSKVDSLKKICKSFNVSICLQLIALLGVAIYLRQYLSNRSLWYDEAAVTLNIIRLSFADFLVQPLPFYTQVASFGFLVIEKLMVLCWGTGEYALRLYPLLCGMGSMGLFYLILKKHIRKEFLPFGLLIFVITPSLVYYSSEVKPYITDVFLSLAAYLLIPDVFFKDSRIVKVILISGISALFVWLSFPVVFVLLGISLTCLGHAILKRKWNSLLHGCILIGSVLISFMLYKHFLLDHLAKVPENKVFWAEGYISLFNLKDWINVINAMIHYPLGVEFFSWMAGMFFILGAYAFFKEDRKSFSIFLLPVALMFLAAVLHIYSCQKRMVLFIVPVLLIVIFKGIELVSLKGGKLKWVIMTASIGLLFAGSAIKTWNNYKDPYREEIKDVLTYVQLHERPEDLLFLYSRSRPAFEYYVSRYGLSSMNRIDGEASFVKLNQKVLLRDMLKLKNAKRVWIIFSHGMGVNGQSDEKLILHYLHNSGARMIQQSVSKGASVYLFDLSNNSFVQQQHQGFGVKKELNFK